ncbi:MAG: tRNA 2-selenouridine(34) synthase MnmH [Bacteroidales bacterium]|nr:tRNA 2-selenouridine(34) synthase MnmH [Bacteroidales bacterium]
MNQLDPESFLHASLTMPVADVRSPAEFEAGHIPGAFNLPLFDNEERARVGTLYKQAGRMAALELGFDLVGPKMSEMVRTARRMTPKGEILLYCWRGGMRSASMAWLLETAGIRTNLLTGGYKAYRSHIRENLVTRRKFIILGGMTGSGKTLCLKGLKEIGEPVIDLEALAVHRGSVFGAIGLGPQPTNEQFENELFKELQCFQPEEMIWLEDESRQIGRVYMPEIFYQAMISSPLIQIVVPESVRTQVILDEYAGLEPTSLIRAVEKISRRLGGLTTQMVIASIDEGRFRDAVELLLPYYDKTYGHSFKSRPEQPVYVLDLTGISVSGYPDAIIKKKSSLVQYRGNQGR